MTPKRLHIKGYSLVLASALMFGSYGVWAKAVGDEFGLFAQAWIRSGMIVIVLLPFAIKAGALFVKIQREDYKWFAVYLLATIFTVIPIYYAFNHLGIGVSSLIFYSVFLITSYVIGAAAFKERLSKSTVAALLLALAGLLLIFGIPTAGFSLLGAFMAILNGVASGTEVAISKKISSKYPALFLMIISWFAIFITNLPAALIAGDGKVPTLSDPSWIVMLGYALASLLGFMFVLEGFKYVDAMVGGLIGLSEILFSVAFGVMIFHEELSVAIVLGLLAILIAGSLPEIASHRKISPANSPELHPEQSISIADKDHKHS